MGNICCTDTSHVSGDYQKKKELNLDTYMQNEIEAQTYIESYEKYKELIEFNKANISSLKGDVFNLKKVLDTGFRLFDDQKRKKLTLVLGNTGCGKSTLLTSMVLGSAAMEITNVKYEIEVMNRRTKQMKKKILQEKVI